MSRVPVVNQPPNPPTALIDQATLPGSPGPQIPDYQLLRRIGEGAYGEVWLARNVIGAFRAIKVVYRSTFKQDGPYEREFNGIRKYETVSGTHPGLLNVLHVGRNDAGGYFYYVMEIADDEAGGPSFDPQSYRPKTLSGEIARRGRLSVGECLGLGASLADALEQLHRHGLIHRDIKPANIIFGRGIPKLADIGLVTEIGQEASLVYTPGYVPPEGPGQPAADVFSLGKVLYIMATGKQANDFPELPTGPNNSELDAFMSLNRVVLQACEKDPRRRFQSARALQAALERLQQGPGAGRPAAGRRRGARFAVAAVLVALLLGTSLLMRDHSKARAGLPERVAALPAAAALTMAYLGQPSAPAAEFVKPELQFDILSRHKGERRFAVLQDGDSLASGVDDYLFVARPSSPGYLYVFQVDSSGSQQWLFPHNASFEFSAGQNPVEAGRTIQVPAEGKACFYLDSHPGMEHVYVVFSASRWTELEGVLSTPATPPAPRFSLHGSEVQKPNGLLTRGVGGTRPNPAPLPTVQRVQQGQTYSLPMSGQSLVASNSFLVIERWFRHVAPE